MKNNRKNNVAVSASKFDGGLAGLIGTSFLAGLAFLCAVLVGGVIFAVAAAVGRSITGGDLQNPESFPPVLLACLGVGAVVFVLSLFFGFALAGTISARWQVRHTVIGGRRLLFNGTAWQLFGSLLKWLFLTVITVGIYGFWVPIKAKKWETKHTVFADNDGASACNNGGNGTNVYVQYAQPAQQPVQQMPVMPYGYPVMYPPMAYHYGTQNVPQNDKKNNR